jgi:hypothetical protein
MDNQVCFGCITFKLSFVALLSFAAIQGSTKLRDIPLFNKSQGFYTHENKLVNMVLENNIIVDLKSDAKISTVFAIAISVPRHYFKLIDFSRVLSKRKG